MKDFEKEFRKWQFDIEGSVPVWQDAILQEALKQGTYGKAKKWIKKHQPKLGDSYVRSIQDQFTLFIASLYEGAYQDLLKLQDKATTEVEDNE